MPLGFHKSHGVSRRPGRVLLAFACWTVLCVGLGVGGVYLWVEQQLRAARRALAQDDLDAAQYYLDRCLRVRPRYGEALFLAARTARRRDAIDDAERHLKACEQQLDKSERLVLERMLLRVQVGRLTPESEQALYQRVLKNDPDSLLIIEALARGYLAAMRIGETGPALDRLLQRAPEHWQGYLWRGQAKEQATEYVGAFLPDYQEAVRLRPESNEARLLLANTLYRVGRLPEAVGHFELLRQRGPNKQVLLGLAKCRADLHQLDEARQLLGTLLIDDPKYVPALVERGRLAFRMGQFTPAEEYLQKAVEAGPYDREAHLMRYRYLDAQNKKAAARQCLVRLDEIDRETLRSLDLMKRARANPDDPAPLYEMGMLFIKLGLEDRGVRWLLMALDKAPDHAPSGAALFDYFTRIGREDLAADYRPDGVPGTKQPR